MHRAIAAVVPALLVTSAFAQSYSFVVDTKQSSVDSALALSTPLVGTFIGNFDATANPTGTKTIPGLFFGSGNNPIAYSATLSGGAASTTPPSGSFGLTVDLEALTASIDGLSIDLLNGEIIGLEVSIEITYPDFHTQNPGAIYPGVSGFGLSLGEVGTLEMLTAAQNGPGGGTLREQGANVYSITVLVPVDIVALGTLNGTPAGDGTPIPAALPLIGTLDLSGEPTLTLTAKTTIDETISFDPPQGFEDQPLDIPTLLPPGNTAHLLFSGTISQITFGGDSTTSIVAIGEANCEPADLNCDGVVDGADVGLLLAAWGTAGPGDLDNNGTVDGADFGLMLGAWG